MFGQRPIMRSLLPDSMDVYVPDGSGGFAGPVRVSRVRFDEEQSASDDAHRSADAGKGTVFVDAVLSVKTICRVLLMQHSRQSTQWDRLILML